VSEPVIIGDATLYLGEKKTVIRDVATCRACWFAWKPNGDRTTEKCPSCGKRRDVRKREYKPNVDALKSWRKKNPGYATEHSRKYREIAVQVVSCGRVACVRCGCDDKRLLEINHKNGGGGKEMRAGKASHRFYIDIARLRRPVDDLELLCRVCNAAHYLELKFGTLPFRVVWEGGDAV
jgi:hypothetical protein